MPSLFSSIFPAANQKVTDNKNKGMKRESSTILVTKKIVKEKKEQGHREVGYLVELSLQISDQERPVVEVLKPCFQGLSNCARDFGLRTQRLMRV